MLVDNGTTLETTIARLGHVESKGLVSVREDEEGPVYTETISTLIHELNGSYVGDQITSLWGRQRGAIKIDRIAPRGIRQLYSHGRLIFGEQ